MPIFVAGTGSLTCANHLGEFDALTGKGTDPGHCQLTAFDTRVREGQIEILARAARSEKRELYAERSWCMSSAWG
jgi:hypothetical protein